ncbi:putative late blight resistance protein homolog R1B-14 [Camellia sinensis]|uniref:putative late blight resistance protein homolog R1B-14 n=1 Tax=Camellia sinensis TaxID=4442 RepID=UPI0010366E7C|nr:putative late blight resistance protein homolog R1B-14 [Camellia sinensis]
MSMSMENRTMGHEEITVGFDDEALTIKELLAGGKKQLQMISIFWMPGLGKTTLAKKLYNDPYITHYFHIRAWTYASQLPSKTEMLLDILCSVNVVFTDEIENTTNVKLGEKLYTQLKGKRYLIVIDDIWDIGAWDDLKMYFPKDNNGSRVMFTSRLKELSMHASPDCHPHLIEIGKQIMKKCGGLPLAIVIIAGLLAKNIKTQESWKQVAQSVSSYIVSDPNQYLDTLALSYSHLPRHLKPCFLYLGAFPEDQKISVQRLIWLWIAEGFIQKIEQKSLEEVAEDYLMDLIQTSLVIVAQKRHLETLKLLNQFSYPTNFQEVKFPTNVKRLTLKYTKIKWENISVLGMLPNLELLKLDVDTASGWQWAITASGFPRLKFLKLKDLDIKQLITCSSHFPSLQHLSLDWCQDLKEVPSSLGDILTLQLIEVNHCRLCVEESVRKIKEEQESIGNNWLKVLIRKNPWGL